MTTPFPHPPLAPAAALVAALTLGCAAPMGAALKASGSPGRYHAQAGPYLGVWEHPVVSLCADEDPDETGGGIELEADFKTGSGQAFEAGWTDEKGLGIGLLHLRSDHEDRRSGLDSPFHGTFLEMVAEARESEGPVEGRLRLGLGAGWAGLGGEHTGTSEWGTALEARLSGGLLLGGLLGLEAQAGTFSYGVPGETVALGWFLGAGITLGL